MQIYSGSIRMLVKADKYLKETMYLHSPEKLPRIKYMAIDADKEMT